MDVRDLAYKAFSEKIMHIADLEQVSPPVMIGACLMILRGLYAVLPPERREGYVSSLHRFVNELERA